MDATAQRGLSLVELLIAMALSLLLMAGVIEVLLSSKQTYHASLALAELQESGRFAFDILAQDLRTAGFVSACPSGVVNASGAGTTQFALERAGIEGYGSGMAAPAWLLRETGEHGCVVAALCRRARACSALGRRQPGHPGIRWCLGRGVLPALRSAVLPADAKRRQCEHPGR
ncbi:prepilin-type N-terminal cleavage/methylation domain-containing protein [Pseudomonas nitroreducens]|uniref:prepilin-type N-terminal cleavage/methylation domain-containing protein n=1 Tax=Pseudomonas nitroreducens TaxID=46680 RepID=UPI0004B7E517